MIQLAEACFTAMAYEQQIREIVEAYQRKVLAEGRFMIRQEFRVSYARRGGAADEPILDPSISYLMSEADFADYYALCDKERAAAGLSIDKPGQCPLANAESLCKEAKYALVDTLIPILGMTSNEIMSRSHTKYKQIEELVLKLFSQYVSPAPQILARIAGSPTSGSDTACAPA